MNISISYKIKRESVIAYIIGKGYTIENHDFGYWRNEYHNSPTWIENIQEGVNVDGRWFTIEDFLCYYFKSNPLNVLPL